MPEEKEPIFRRRSSFTLLLTIVFVASLIILIVVLLTRNTSTTFSEQTFINTLENGRIATVVETPKSTTVVRITGTYYKDQERKSKSQYTVVFNWEDFNSEKDWYWYADAAKDTKIDLPNSTVSQLIIDKGLEISVEDPYVVTFWDQWGPTILMLGGSAVVVIFLFSRLTKSVGASNNSAMEFNKSRARNEKNIKVKFDDVAGADEEKTEMKELVDYLKDPKKFTKFGAKLPKGVLLVGPPGCGKTLLAKAVAGEAGVPFFSISGSDFVEMFVGVGAGRVRDMFRIAKQNAPCLVFIDEIDAVGRQRGAGLGGGNDEREQTLNQLLVEMDGFNDNSGIIVIAATNRDDVLDPALLRAGRFDRKITVSLPDRKGREEIFKVHSRGKTLSPNVDFGALARRTVGFSGADIENIMNEAAILAIRKGRTAIDIDDIDEAIDRRIAGPAKTSRALNEHERRIVAYHEAGHAIIGIRNPHSDKVQKITIIPRDIIHSCKFKKLNHDSSE